MLEHYNSDEESSGEAVLMEQCRQCIDLNGVMETAIESNTPQLPRNAPGVMNLASQI